MPSALSPVEMQEGAAPEVRRRRRSHLSLTLTWIGAVIFSFAVWAGLVVLALL